MRPNGKHGRGRKRDPLTSSVKSNRHGHLLRKKTFSKNHAQVHQERNCFGNASSFWSGCKEHRESELHTDTSRHEGKAFREGVQELAGEKKRPCFHHVSEKA